jgi:hypothetical protein
MEKGESLFDYIVEVYYLIRSWLSFVLYTGERQMYR